MRAKQIQEYSSEYYNYIEEWILPNEDDRTQVKYYQGNMGYDEAYVEEHMEYNKKINIKLKTK